MARSLYITTVDTEDWVPRVVDERPRRGDWDKDGYGWVYAAWWKAREEEREYRLPEGAMPSSLKLVHSHEKYPIFCGGPFSVGVSQSFRDVIERFEPGLHQFIPFQLIDSNDHPIAEPYYFMNVVTSLDAFLMQHSAARWFWAPVGDHPPSIEILDNKRLAMSRPKIAGKHIWRSPIASEFIVSDTLYSALIDAGFQDWLYSPDEYAELDIVWDREENRGPVDRWYTDYHARQKKARRAE